MGARDCQLMAPACGLCTKYTRCGRVCLGPVKLGLSPTLKHMHCPAGTPATALHVPPPNIDHCSHFIHGVGCTFVSVSGVTLHVAEGGLSEAHGRLVQLQDRAVAVWSGNTATAGRSLVTRVLQRSAGGSIRCKDVLVAEQPGSLCVLRWGLKKEGVNQLRNTRQRLQCGAGHLSLAARTSL